MKRITSFALVLLMCLCLGHEAATQAAERHHRLKLVFSVEEAFVNSPVQNRDIVGIKRVAEALQKLQDRYDVYVTLVPSQTDQNKLFAALDIFKRAGIQFYLDAWTSDSLAPPRPAKNPANTPYDREHGVTLSIAQLESIKTLYGKSFAGIRLHEVFAANLSVSMFHIGKDWYPTKSCWFPKDRFFNAGRLEKFFSFAKNNGMKVIFSDPWWFADGNHDLHNPAVNQKVNEEQLAGIMKRYPYICTLMYANNEPLKNRPDAVYARLDGWPALFPAAAIKYSAGYGLSDQAWVYDRIKLPEWQCPPKVIATWAVHAVEQGASAIEFEPYWYFFNFPRDAREKNDFESYSKYEDRGYPNENFHVLIDALDRARP